MIKIKLIPEEPYFNKCEVAVIDVTDGKEKQRCKITVEYGEYDVEELKKKGITDKPAAMKYYRGYIYDLIKYYIIGDFEYTGGLDQVLDIISEHLPEKF